MLRWIVGRLWPALKTGLRRWSSDHGSLHSAALAYYAAFSLFPLCLTLIAVLGFVAGVSGRVQDGQQRMLDLVRANVGPWMADQLQTVLLAVRSQAAVNGPFGLLALALSCLAIFVQLEAMFDTIWKDPRGDGRGWLGALWTAVYQRIVALLMLFAVGALVVLLFAANMGLSGIKMFFLTLPVSHTAFLAAQWLFVIAGNAVGLAVVFRAIPRAAVRWRDALCGGGLVALVWQIGQHFLAMFVISDRYSVYGVVGSFIALMVWFYYASAAVFLGAEVVRSLGRENA